MFNDDDELIDSFTGCKSLNIDEFNEVCENFRPSDLTALHLNIRGCRTNFNDFVTTLSILDLPLSCFALTETNITEDIDANYKIRGFKCENQYAGHGIKLYIKDSISYNCIDTLTICNDIIECIFVKLCLKYNRDVILGAVYRPHSSSIRTFNNYLNDYVLPKLRPHQTVVILGDFNINLHNFSNDAPINEFVDSMQSYNLSQCISEITRYNNNVNAINSSIIDHIWTNLNRPFTTYVLECGISDHYPIIIHSEFVNTSNLTHVTFRDYSQPNLERFLVDFPGQWYSSNLRLTNATDSVNKFIEWFNNILNLYFPIKTKQLGNKKLKNPWINDKILICIKKKHKFYKLMKEGKLEISFYNKYRNLVNFAVKSLKKRYYNNAFISLKKDMKGTWQLLNELLDRKQKSQINELIVNDVPSSNPTTIATSLNNFFCSISSELRASLPPHGDSNLFNNLPSKENSLYLRPSRAS